VEVVSDPDETGLTLFLEPEIKFYVKDVRGK
jgi:hypothetical protein